MALLRAAYSTYPANAQSGVVVQAGDLIIVGYSYNVGTDQSPTISDNAGGGTNTYSTRIAGFTAGGPFPSFANAWYAIAKASETLTITCSAVADNGISVHVVSGANTTLAQVQDGSAVTGTTSAATSHTSSDIATGNANDYLWILWYQENTADTLTENGTGFVQQTQQGNHYHSTFDLIVLSTGNYHDAVTSGASSEYGYILLAFKADSVVETPSPEQSRQRFGFNPSRYPNKRRRFRATQQAPTLNEENLVAPTPEPVDAVPQFGWSPMRRPIRRRTLRASIPGLADAVAADTTLACSLNVSMVASANLSTSIEMAAAATVTINTAASLSTQITMASAVNVSINASAALTTSITMASAVTLSITQSSALSTAITMAASATLSITVAPALTTSITLASAVTLSITVGADLTAGSGLASAVTLSILASAALSTSITMAATPAVSIAAAAALSTSITMASAQTLSIVVSASLLTAITFATAKTVSITISGSLTTGIQMAAGVTLSISTAASLSTSIRMAAAMPLSITLTAEFGPDFLVNYIRIVGLTAGPLATLGNAAGRVPTIDHLAGVL